MIVGSDPNGSPSPQCLYVSALVIAPQATSATGVGGKASSTPTLGVGGRRCLRRPGAQQLKRCFVVPHARARIRGSPAETSAKRTLSEATRPR